MASSAPRDIKDITSTMPVAELKEQIRLRIELLNEIRDAILRERGEMGSKEQEEERKKGKEPQSNTFKLDTGVVHPLMPQKYAERSFTPQERYYQNWSGEDSKRRQDWRAIEGKKGFDFRKGSTRGLSYPELTCEDAEMWRKLEYGPPAKQTETSTERWKTGNEEVVWMLGRHSNLLHARGLLQQAEQELKKLDELPLKDARESALERGVENNAEMRQGVMKQAVGFLHSVDVEVNVNLVNRNRKEAPGKNISDSLRFLVIDKLSEERRRLEPLITKYRKEGNSARESWYNERMKKINDLCSKLQFSDDPEKVARNQATPEDITASQLAGELKTLKAGMPDPSLGKYNPSRMFSGKQGKDNIDKIIEMVEPKQGVLERFNPFKKNNP